MRDSFITYSPISIAVYFACCLGLTLFMRNPVLLGISLVLAIFQYVAVRGASAWAISFGVLCCGGLIACICAFLGVHEGPVLFTLFGSYAFTVEAVWTGVVYGEVFCTITVLLAIIYRYMTIEKFLYLFSGLMPSATITVSHTFRFVPVYQQEMRDIHQTALCMGLGARNGIFAPWLKGLSSTMLTMHKSLMSIFKKRKMAMMSRGYGSAKRTTFTRYDFTPHDLVVFMVTLVCMGFVTVALVRGSLNMQYYPSFAFSTDTLRFTISLIAYICLFAMPLAIDLRGEFAWRMFVSKI